MGNLKTYIIVGLIILAVLAAIFFIGKYKGKQWTPDTVKLPSDTQPTVIMQSGSTSWNPGLITDSLYKDIDCVACLRNFDLYTEVSALSNTQLVAVHNDWNERYFKNNRETLRQAMDNEYYTYSGPKLAGVADAIKERLKSLGL